MLVVSIGCKLYAPQKTPSDHSPQGVVWYAPPGIVLHFELLRVFRKGFHELDPFVFGRVDPGSHGQFSPEIFYTRVILLFHPGNDLRIEIGNRFESLLVEDRDQLDGLGAGQKHFNGGFPVVYTCGSGQIAFHAVGHHADPPQGEQVIARTAQPGCASNNLPVNVDIRGVKAIEKHHPFDP